MADPKDATKADAAEDSRRILIVDDELHWIRRFGFGRNKN